MLRLSLALCVLVSATALAVPVPQVDPDLEGGHVSVSTNECPMTGSDPCTGPHHVATVPLAVLVVRSVEPGPGESRVGYTACPIHTGEPRGCDAPRYFSFTADGEGVRVDDCEPKPEGPACRTVAERTLP